MSRTEWLIVNEPASWDRITAAARAQVSLEIERDASTPLLYGQYIAWARCAKVGSATDEISPVHRVGAPIGNAPHTTCGEAIPPAARWLSLSPAMTRTMARCGFCEATLDRSPVEIAA